MSEKFNAGEVVELKSGGPKMTVNWEEGGEVYCTWFDAKNTVQQKAFTADALKKIDG